MNARLLVPAVLLVVLTGCSAGSDPDDGPDVAAAPSPTAAPTSAAAEPEPSPTPAGTLIEVTFTGGQVGGVESRVPVKLGEQVTLRITSDVAEEIHVHGYDHYIDLVPGQVAELTFTADVPGSYEVELHEARRPLFQLRVA